MTDLPFGKRLGSRADNRTLYPQAIEQMRRALRPSTAPAAAAQPPQQAQRAPADDTAAPSTDGLLHTVAAVGFFGVFLFCAVQAFLAPRKTFCSQDMPEPRAKAS